MQQSRKNPIDLPRIPAGRRVYAIGDVHGELELLADLLTALRDDARSRGPANTTLIFLGDIIDRGPAGAQLLQGLAGENMPGLIILRGNHESTLIDVYNGNLPAADFWKAFGGTSTLAGFGFPQTVIDGDTAELITAMRQRIDHSLISWLESLPTRWSIGDFFFAHAGIRPGRALAAQREEDLLWIRHDFLCSGSDHGKIIVHGHTIEPGAVELEGNRIGLDTGAHEHGVLSALVLQGDARWVVQSHRSNLMSSTTAVGPTDYEEISLLLADILTRDHDERQSDRASSGKIDDRSAAAFMPPSRPASLMKTGLLVGVAALMIAGVAAAVLPPSLWPGPQAATPVPTDERDAISVPILRKSDQILVPASSKIPSPAGYARANSDAPAAQSRRQANRDFSGNVRLHSDMLPPSKFSSGYAGAQDVDPYAGRVAKRLTGLKLRAAIAADRLATRELNLRQIRQIGGGGSAKNNSLMGGAEQ